MTNEPAVRCEICGFAFKSKVGLTQHRRRKHAEAYNDQKCIDIIKCNENQKKRRWNGEEVSMMAKIEAKLQRRGVVRITDALLERIPNRTRDAIRGRRKRTDYADMVAGYVASLGHDNEMVVPPRAPDTTESVIDPPQAGPVARKTRWEYDELLEMAQTEARLLRMGVGSMNVALSTRTPGRTLEAIKSQRRRNEYRAMVGSFSERMRPRRPVEDPSSGDDRATVDGPSPSKNISQANSPPRSTAARAAGASTGASHTGDGAEEDEGTVETATAVEVAGGSFTPLPDTQEILTPVQGTGSIQTPPVRGYPPETVTDTATDNEGGAFTPGPDDWRFPIIEAALAMAVRANVCPELLQEAISIPLGNTDRLQRLIDADLQGLLPPVERRRPSQRAQPRQDARNGRARRRAAYARIQALYKSSRTGCARVVLAGQWAEADSTLPIREQVSFWKPLMETPSKLDHRMPPVGTTPEWTIVDPITKEEVTRHFRGLKDDAAGPDHRRKIDLAKIDAEALACRFNLWLLAGIAPESFRHGVTVLIPKTSNCTEPKQYRPISMGSIMCRLYHRFLAERIERHYSISERQKVFRMGDGIADNTYILRNVLAAEMPVDRDRLS